MRFAVVFIKRNLRIRIESWRIEHSKSKARSKQTMQGTIQVGLSQQALLNCLEYCVTLSLHARTRIPADEVGPGFESNTHTFFHRRREVMPVEDVGNRGTVGDYISLKPPVAPQVLFQQ